MTDATQDARPAEYTDHDMLDKATSTNISRIVLMLSAVPHYARAELSRRLVADFARQSQLLKLVASTGPIDKSPEPLKDDFFDNATRCVLDSLEIAQKEGRIENSGAFLKLLNTVNDACAEYLKTVVNDNDGAYNTESLADFLAGHCTLFVAAMYLTDTRKPDAAHIIRGNELQKERTAILAGKVAPEAASATKH